MRVQEPYRNTIEVRFGCSGGRSQDYGEILKAMWPTCLLLFSARVLRATQTFITGCGQHCLGRARLMRVGLSHAKDVHARAPLALTPGHERTFS